VARHHLREGLLSRRDERCLRASWVYAAPVVEADDYWPAQGFVAAGLGLALIPALGLGVQHHGVAVRRLRRADQPERQVLAVTRRAIGGTTAVQAMIRALQTQAAQARGSRPS
jgi:DNA-binding transcriptional LysR family regulator